VYIRGAYLLLAISQSQPLLYLYSPVVDSSFTSSKPFNTLSLAAHFDTSGDIEDNGVYVAYDTEGGAAFMRDWLR